MQLLRHSFSKQAAIIRACGFLRIHGHSLRRAQHKYEFGGGPNSRESHDVRGHEKLHVSLEEARRG